MKTLLCLLLAPALAAAPGKPVPAQSELTVQEFLQGTARLQRHLSQRGEDPWLAGDFIQALNADILGRVREGAPFPIKRDAFEAFLKYEAAWARKTRDAKNPQVDAATLAHEKQRAQELKDRFFGLAKTGSPALFFAFRSAVRKVRAELAAKKGEGATSGSLFDGQVDDSYTKVDAGDEALEQGDPAAAAAAASDAIAENPDNADAFVLKAGAEYEQGNAAAAVADAQQALALDPANAQAQAVVDLLSDSGLSAKSGDALLTQANTTAGSLATDGAAPAGSRVSDSGPAAAPSLAVPPPAASAAATPALASRLSADLTAQAARTAALDGQAAAQQLGRALSLDPRNGEALDWMASLALRARDYKSALSAAEQALAVNPRDAHGWFAKGRALAGQGADEAALASLHEAASLDPAYQAAEQAFTDQTAAKAASGLQSGAAAAASYEPGEIFDPWMSAQVTGFSPARRHKRRGKYQIPPNAVLALGALLLAFGVATAFRSHRAA